MLFYPFQQHLGRADRGNWNQWWRANRCTRPTSNAPHRQRRTGIDLAADAPLPISLPIGLGSAECHDHAVRWHDFSRERSPSALRCNKSRESASYPRRLTFKSKPDHRDLRWLLPLRSSWRWSSERQRMDPQKLLKKAETTESVARVRSIPRLGTSPSDWTMPGTGSLDEEGRSAERHSVPSRANSDRGSAIRDPRKRLSTHRT